MVAAGENGKTAVAVIGDLRCRNRRRCIGKREAPIAGIDDLPGLWVDLRAGGGDRFQRAFGAGAEEVLGAQAECGRDAVGEHVQQVMAADTNRGQGRPLTAINAVDQRRYRIAPVIRQRDDAQARIAASPEIGDRPVAGPEGRRDTPLGPNGREHGRGQDGACVARAILLHDMEVIVGVRHQGAAAHRLYAGCGDSLAFGCHQRAHGGRRGGGRHHPVQRARAGIGGDRAAIAGLAYRRCTYGAELRRALNKARGDGLPARPETRLVCDLHAQLQLVEVSDRPYRYV